MELTSSSVQSVMLHPVMQALVAGVFSWLSVTLGAAFIFTRREFSRKAMDCLLGAAGGMMLGAAFFGLLQPAMEMAGHAGRLGFLPVVFGLLLGAAFLLLLDRALPHLHLVQGTTEGISTRWRRSVLLVTAMALHHIPEGLAIGVGSEAEELDLPADARCKVINRHVGIQLRPGFHLGVPVGVANGGSAWRSGQRRGCAR